MFTSKYSMSFFAMAGIIIISGVVIAQHSGNSNKTPEKNLQTDKKIQTYELRLKLRGIWEDNAIQSRNLITSLVNALPGTEEANKKLTSNQKRLTLLLKQYLSNLDETQVNQLLNNHFVYSLAIVNSFKKENKKTILQLQNKHKNNSFELTQLLASIHPSVNKNLIFENLNTQMELLSASARHRYNKEYELEQKSFERLHETYLIFSDQLSDLLSAHLK